MNISEQTWVINITGNEVTAPNGSLVVETGTFLPDGDRRDIAKAVVALPGLIRTLHEVDANLIALLNQSDLLADAILPSMLPTELNHMDQMYLATAINAIRALMAQGVL